LAPGSAFPVDVFSVHGDIWGAAGNDVWARAPRRRIASCVQRGFGHLSTARRLLLSRQLVFYCGGSGVDGQPLDGRAQKTPFQASDSLPLT
jgi:hypothetical protein